MLLSGHGASGHGDGGGPAGFGLIHAAAPAQENAVLHAQDKGHENDEQSENDPILSWDTTQIVDSSTSEAGDGFAFVEIVFADPIPMSMAGGSKIHANIEHPDNSAPGHGDSTQFDLSAGAGGWQIDGSLNGPAPKGGGHNPNEVAGQTSGSNDHSGQQRDSEETSNDVAQQSGFFFQLLHADGTYDPNGIPATPAAQPTLARPINTVPVAPPQALPTGVQPAKSATIGDSDTQTPAAVTPLALTPTRQVVTLSAPSSAHQDLIITTVSDDHVAPGPTLTAAAAQAAVPVGHPFGQVAAIVPSSVLAGVRAVQAAVPAAIQTAAREISAVGAVVANADAIASNAIAGSLPVKMAYNFVRFDAAAFHDAVSVFATELATLTVPGSHPHSSARAWIITGTVLGFDAIFLTYWHQKVRREKQVREAFAPANPRAARRRRD